MKQNNCLTTDVMQQNKLLSEINKRLSIKVDNLLEGYILLNVIKSDYEDLIKQIESYILDE